MDSEGWRKHADQVKASLRKRPKGASVHFLSLTPKKPITQEDLRDAKRIYEAVKEHRSQHPEL